MKRELKMCSFCGEHYQWDDGVQDNGHLDATCMANLTAERARLMAQQQDLNERQSRLIAELMRRDMAKAGKEQP